MVEINVRGGKGEIKQGEKQGIREGASFSKNERAFSFIDSFGKRAFFSDCHIRSSWGKQGQEAQAICGRQCGLLPQAAQSVLAEKPKRNQVGAFELGYPAVLPVFALQGSASPPTLLPQTRSCPCFLPFPALDSSARPSSSPPPSENKPHPSL